MIIETIIVLGLLGSFAGLFLFAKHFLKHKKHVDKKKNQEFIEKVVKGKVIKVPKDLFPRESFIDKLMDFFLRHSSKIAFICFVLVFINIVFQPFSQHTQTTPQPVPVSTPTHINGSDNTWGDTFNEMFGSSFADGKVPWWFYVIIFGIPMWLAWRFIRGPRYDF